MTAYSKFLEFLAETEIRFVEEESYEGFYKDIIVPQVGTSLILYKWDDHLTFTFESSTGGLFSIDSEHKSEGGSDYG